MSCANLYGKGKGEPRVKQQSPAIQSDAVSYLRVSSLGQVETDFDPEGISLPAQRKAITARAKELGAVIVNEFTDPGKSAKSIEHRDAFREMIATSRPTGMFATSSYTPSPALPATGTTMRS